jgi:negative regulator of flagellin synthesis FlgM
MKIPGDIPKITGIYNKQNKVRGLEKAGTDYSQKDVVSISGKAKDFQTIMKTLKNVPDIRQEKVDELSSKYRSGSYDVSGKDIADKIVDSIFDKKA